MNIIKKHKHEKLALDLLLEQERHKRMAYQSSVKIPSCKTLIGQFEYILLTGTKTPPEGR